jgi:hypothetical protein
MSAPPVSIHPGLIQEVRSLCTDKGWRKNLPPNPRGYEGPFSQYIFGAYCALAHSEITEMLEAYRDKVWSDTCIPDSAGTHNPHCSSKPHSPGKPLGVGPEAADAIIRIVDMADIWDIQINDEISRVIEYGWTRPYQHGGRTL